MVKILVLIVTLSAVGFSLVSCGHQPPGAGLSDGLKQMNDAGAL